MADKPDYEEPKITTSFSLTAIARDKLQELTDFYGLKSRSDLLEQLSRGLIPGVMWLKEDEKIVTVEAIDYYIKEHRKVITEQEENPEGDKEFVLLLSIKIAYLRLIRYRLMGDAENPELDSMEKVFKKLLNEKKGKK